MKWQTVNIDLNKLIDICSTGRKSKEELLETFKIINKENIHKVFKYHKFNDGFASKTTCSNDGTKIIGTMGPSYQEFLDKLFTILNVNPKLKYLIAQDNQNLEDVLKARIEVLKSLPDEAALQNEFPIIYKDLQDGRRVINDIKRKMKQIKEDKTKTSEEKEKEIHKLKTEEREYYSCALSPGFTAADPKHGFIYKQVELYKRFVERRKEYKELIEQTVYNKYIEKNFDLNKIALYTVHGYLLAIEASTNRETQLKYYKLVENYLNSKNIKKDTEIVIAGEIINYNTISTMAKKAYNKINRVDIHLEWELLPTGSGYETVHETDKTKRKIPMSQEEKDKLVQIGKEQTEFFMNTNYSAKAIGLKTFKGYLAYIYPNGLVVLEKDFREKYPTTAEGAIYILKARDFEMLSSIGKTDLIYNPLLVAHKYHRGDWTSKIESYINQEGTEEEQQEAKVLINRLQKKKNI